MTEENEKPKFRTFRISHDDLQEAGLSSDVSVDEVVSRLKAHHLGPLKEMDQDASGQIIGWSCPTDIGAGDTIAALPAIDPAVKALYQAQGFNTTGM